MNTKNKWSLTTLKKTLEISTSFEANLLSDLLQMVALAKRSTAEAKKRPQCLSVPEITAEMAKTRKFIVNYVPDQKSILSTYWQ